MITKAKAQELEEDRLAHAAWKEDAAIHTFILNSRYDIGGDAPWNLARPANHSRDPNCESLLDRGHIWIVALWEITPEEKITYDCRFCRNLYLNHPCRCGTRTCTGYFLRSDLR